MADKNNQVYRSRFDVWTTKEAYKRMRSIMDMYKEEYDLKKDTTLRIFLVAEYFKNIISDKTANEINREVNELLGREKCRQKRVSGSPSERSHYIKNMIIAKSDRFLGDLSDAEMCDSLNMPQHVFSRYANQINREVGVAFEIRKSLI